VQPRVGYDSAWLREFLRRGCGIGFDETQAAEIAALAERKLVDLFDVAEAAAVASCSHSSPTPVSPDWLLRRLPTQPTHWELDRAGRILNLTL
jgi:hypothetical protein